jgi:hypothetical protein
MPLLPYCVLLGDLQTRFPATGLSGSAVRLLAHDELIAAYSHLEQTEFSVADLRQAALEFHDVVHAMFTDRAVIPFRFPTWLTAEKLGEHLEQQAEAYSKFLRDHADDVQMEIRVAAQSELSTTRGSGTEYLRSRSTKAQKIRASADTLKARVAEFATDWRERPTPDGLRLFALVNRRGVADFRERLGSGAQMQNFTCRVSGPWPATEFVPQPALGGVQP